MRRFLLLSTSVALVAGLMVVGCTKKSNPVSSSGYLTGPTGSTVVLAEGFEGDLSNWETNFMINIGDNYPQMRITTDAAHGGTHSITSDSNQTALVYNIANRVETGTAGIQFYIMAKAAGEINFSVVIGQNAGSSGGLGKQFGIGFDSTGFIKTVTYDMFSGESDSMISPIQFNHWYKCVVEFNWTDSTITYNIDGVQVRSTGLPTQDMMGIDRLLVFRGVSGSNSEGPKQYYADDIVLYTKP